MAADLARTPITGLKVQACGDCNLLNFDGFVTPEPSIIFDINDFDETPGRDVKRLVPSLVLAARFKWIVLYPRSRLRRQLHAQLQARVGVAHP
jgi:uncharacterized protein (DUF2252 family)